MSDARNYTTINAEDIATYGLDQDLLGKTVTAAEFKKITGMADEKPLEEVVAPVTGGNKGVAETEEDTTADEADEPVKAKKSTSKKASK